MLNQNQGQAIPDKEDGAVERHAEHGFPPVAMTMPCFRFFLEFFKLGDFFMYVTGWALGNARRIEELVEEARKIQLYEDESKYAEHLAHAKQIMEELSSHLPLLNQMVFCRVVDNYMTYLSELLALIFQSRPETLRSSEQERLDFILQHSTMEDLIAAISEKRVLSLSYRGMSDLASHLSERFGLQIFEGSQALENAVRIVEVRNLVVHNRGVVNKVFLQRVPGVRATLGESIEVTMRGAHEDADFLAMSVTRIDSEAAQKYGLPQTERRESLTASRTRENLNRRSSPKP